MVWKLIIDNGLGPAYNSHDYKDKN